MKASRSLELFGEDTQYKTNRPSHECSCLCKAGQVFGIRIRMSYAFCTPKRNTARVSYMIYVYWLFFSFFSAGTNLFLTAFTIWLNQYTFRKLSAVFPTR